MEIANSSGLREKVLILESLSKLFNLYFLPKPNSTQKSVWTDGGKDCHFIVSYCWYSERYPLTCLQTAYFIFPVLKFPCLKFSFMWQLWNHKVILIPFLQLLLSVTSIQYIWNLSLEKYCFSASSALLCATTDDSSADKIKICITHWHVLTPSWLPRMAMFFQMLQNQIYKCEISRL